MPTPLCPQTEIAQARLSEESGCWNEGHPFSFIARPLAKEKTWKPAVMVEQIIPGVQDLLEKQIEDPAQAEDHTCSCQNRNYHDRRLKDHPADHWPEVDSVLGITYHATHHELCHGETCGHLMSCLPASNFVGNLEPGGTTSRSSHPAVRRGGSEPPAHKHQDFLGEEGGRGPVALTRAPSVGAEPRRSCLLA